MERIRNTDYKKINYDHLSITLIIEPCCFAEPEGPEDRGGGLRDRRLIRCHRRR